MCQAASVPLVDHSSSRRRIITAEQVAVITNRDSASIAIEVVVDHSLGSTIEAVGIAAAAIYYSHQELAIEQHSICSVRALKVSLPAAAPRVLTIASSNLFPLRGLLERNYLKPQRGRSFPFLPS